MTHIIKKYFYLIILFSVFSLSSLGAYELYWEQAEPFSARTGSFPVSAHSNNFSVVAWQETTPARAGNAGYINICLAVKEPDKDWINRGVISGPYSFSSTEPSIISIVIDAKDRIVIAAAASSSQTEILISEDKGYNFSRKMIDMDTNNSVAPRIFLRADGGFILFITRGVDLNLSLYYSCSDDGFTWSKFNDFSNESGLSLSFLPTHASIGQRDFVFFQSIITNVNITTAFQLFYKISNDGGKTWTAARRFTTFNDPAIQTQSSPDVFDNQRPHLAKFGNDLLLVWERRTGTQLPQIYSAVINQNGVIIGQVEHVNSEDAYCNNPIGFIHENTPSVVWFDNRRGNNRIILAQKNILGWQNYQLSSDSTESSFVRPVIDKDKVYMIWQTTVRNENRIYMLAPDHSVSRAVIIPVNFSPSIPNRSEKPRVTWNIPYDTSGILGFSYIWNRNKEQIPPKQIMAYNTGNSDDMSMELNATEDGQWYFSMQAQDFAGNWSEPTQIGYYRKAVPPPALVIKEPNHDGEGFLTSNSFTMEWEPSHDPFISGYTWNIQLIEDAAEGEISINDPPSLIMGTSAFIRYQNHDDGMWAFTVCAVDRAGNISEKSNMIFKTNKYIPYTSVSYIDYSQNDQGTLSIDLLGRGFTTNGEISTVVIENEDEQKFYSNFEILSDKKISRLSFENLDEGGYTLKLFHTQRGWYTSSFVIPVKKTSTIKYGDYTKEYKPFWTILPEKIKINPLIILAIFVCIFSFLGMLAAIRGIGGVLAQAAIIKQEVSAIMTGGFMPVEKKQKIKKIQKKGRGLRFKIASFTIALVLSVVIMISTPIYMIVTSTLRTTLLESLKSRTKVLLEGLASSARAYMPQGERGSIELGFLPAQSAALPEANYVTITGYSQGSIHNDHVLATNDPDILSKIDTVEYRQGVSRITDFLTPDYEQYSAGLNESARSAAGDIAKSISQLSQEGQSIGLTDMQRLTDIQVTIRSLETKFSTILSELSSEIESYPEFSEDNIFNKKNRIFIFYKPVMFRYGNDENFFRGLIRLEVSLDSIIDQIYHDQFILLQTVVIVALVVILIGIIAALILSSLIIMPIRKLVSHIEIIRDTDDKAKLAGRNINIKTGDEIAILGNTINDMTHGLVAAAIAASDLSIGKEIQKKFIPLEIDKEGNKMSSGFAETDKVYFFGYYEGAKGVSGDYYDYKDLDGRYYAIIKCDVAGKGIPAALIMIQVATMFLNYFKQWKPNAKGMHIEEVVYQINEFIETLAFKGRFAAFTLCLFDSETGIARFCNAGDKIIHLYDASEKRIRTITLPETPAAGVLPNMVIEPMGGYKVQTLQIDKGDILLLYTDGIEEAKRKFRNEKFEVIKCTYGENDTKHENHSCGQADEEMGPERVEAIINAVMTKDIYTLKKYHNPEGIIELQFDFSSCNGYVEEVIMAMISVEKMFRCYKDPAAGGDSRVLVEKKVDEFLKNHFLQYRVYCSHTLEFTDNKEYIYYSHLKEDDQYDDLTILGLKRK